MGKGGRKPQCDGELIARAVQLKKGGASNKDIIAALGIGESTFYRWVNEPKTELQRELGERLKKSEADYKNALLSIIAKAGQEKDWKAAAWLLERKYPHEYSRHSVLRAADGDSAPTIVLGVEVRTLEDD